MHSESLREAIEAALQRHGVAGPSGLVDELVDVADRHSEWWPDSTVVSYVGTIREDTVRQWTHAHQVERRQMSRAEDVRRGKDEMVGRGSHWAEKRRGA